MKFYNYLNEGKYNLNVANTPLDKAIEYSISVFGSEEQLYETIPDFDKNYMALQKKYQKEALDIPRIKMPVIEPTDMKLFDKRLRDGKIDIFKPYALGKQHFPKNPSKEKGDEWIYLGQEDGDKNDDKVLAKWTSIPGKELKPLQGQVWLEKLVNNIKKFGPPKTGSPVLKTTIIVSKEKYILDGHHRHGQVMLTDPSLKMQSLHIPLDIDLLLKMGRSYGAAIGNEPKA
jgi:hypothetical protein